MPLYRALKSDSIPVIPAGDVAANTLQAAIAELAAEKAVKGEVVDLVSNQTVGGEKTFTQRIRAGDSTTINSGLNERAINLVSTDAVMRVHRVATNDTSNPAVELILSDPDGISNRQYWDFYVGRNPGKFAIRDRSTPFQSKDRLTINSNGDVIFNTESGSVFASNIQATSLLTANSIIANGNLPQLTLGTITKAGGIRFNRANDGTQGAYIGYSSLLESSNLVIGANGGSSAGLTTGGYVSILTAGTEKIRVGSNGFVGLGTPTPGCLAQFSGGGVAITSSTTAATDPGAGSLSVSNNISTSSLDLQNRFLLRQTATRSTTDATVTELFLDAANTQRLVLPNNTLWHFRIFIGGQRTTASEGGSIEISGSIRRGANAASTTLISSVKVSHLGSLTWDANVSTETTSGALRIQVTGVTGATINWASAIQILQVN